MLKKDKKEMYNKEIKEEFIKYKEFDTTTPSRYLPRLFEETSIFEREYDKDVSEWNIKEIEKFYINKSTPSKYVLEVINGQLKIYSDWLIRKHNMKIENMFALFTSQDFDKYVDTEKYKTKYLTRKDFREKIDELMNPVDQFIFTCLWYGISGKNGGFENIWKLKLEDITEDSVIFPTTGKKVKVGNDLYEYAHEAADEVFFYSVGERQKVYKMINDDPEKIIKPTNKRQKLEDNTDPKMIERQNKNIYRKFVRAKKEINLNCTPRSIIISGMIDKIITLSKTRGISYENILSDPLIVNKLEKRYVSISEKSELMKTIRNIC